MYRLHVIPIVLFRSIIGESGRIRASLPLFGIPVSIALLSYVLQFHAHQSFLKLIVTSMTLFVGFSMNAVVLLLRYAETSNANEDLIEQVRNTAVYLVTLGIVLVFAALVGIVTIENSPLTAIGRGESSLYYGLLVHFFMVTLLFPARIFSVVENIGGGGSMADEIDRRRSTESTTSQDRFLSPHND